MIDLNQQPPSRPRVLLVAYACHPQRGSEPGVGWSRAVLTSRHFDTWVLCEGRDAAGAVARYVSRHGEIPNLHFAYVSRTVWQNCLRRLPGMFYLAYNLWHRRAYRVARRLHEQVRFDLVHQLNLCGYREPGYAWKLDAPFVWGPVGGSQNFPWRFLRRAGLAGGIRETARNVLNNLQLRFSRRVGRAARKAAVLLAANTTNQRDFARLRGVKATVMVETGTNPVRHRADHDFRHGGGLRIVWSGEFSHRKALNLLLEALAALPGDVPYELRVLGRGPLERRWRKLARSLGVDRHCTWLGWLPHREAVAQLAWADVLAFTSLRDTTGTVILEAISAATPVVCFDHQGAGDVVTPECGIKLPVRNPRQAVTAFRDAIATLERDRGKLETLSRNALARAEDHLWPRKGEEMRKVYCEVLHQAGNGS